MAHQWYANYLTAMGRFEEAEREMRAASELDPLSMIAFAATGWVYCYAGEHERAIRQLEEAPERDPAWLERALDERAHSMAFLRVDPQLRPLHGHPGYERLVRRMGLADDA